MSVQAMAWAIEQRRVTEPAARHVLLCLANYASKTGHDAWCSAGTLAEETGLSERTVRYKLDTLLESGVIRLGDQAVVAAKVKRADRRPVVYDLDMRGACPAPREERGATDAPREVERGATDDATGCKPRQERGAAAAPKPKARANQELSEKQRASALVLPAWLPREAWAKWDKFRNRKRSTWTDDAQELSLRTLTELWATGHAPLAVIEQSIERGWTGLFPVKGASNATSRKPSLAERAHASATAAELRDRAERYVDADTLAADAGVLQSQVVERLR